MFIERQQLNAHQKMDEEDLHDITVVGQVPKPAR